MDLTSISWVYGSRCSVGWIEGSDSAAEASSLASSSCLSSHVICTCIFPTPAKDRKNDTTPRARSPIRTAEHGKVRSAAVRGSIEGGSASAGIGQTTRDPCVETPAVQTWGCCSGDTYSTMRRKESKSSMLHQAQSSLLCADAKMNHTDISDRRYITLMDA